MISAQGARVRPAIRKLAIAAVFLLLPAAAFSLWDAAEARRVAGDIRDISGRGEPLTTADRPLMRDMSAAQRDAARFYFAAAMLASGANPGSIHRRVQPAGVADVAERTRSATEVLTAWAAGADDPLALASIDAVYAQAEPAFDLIERAAALDFAGFTPDRGPYTLLTSDLLQLHALNAIRTDAFTWRGDVRAPASHLASVRLERALSIWSRPSKTGSLTLLLSRAKIATGDLRLLQAAYETAPDGSIEYLRTVRAQITESVWPDASGRSPHLQRIRLRTPRTGDLDFGVLLLRPWLTRQLHYELQTWREALDAASQAWPDRLQAVAALAKKYPRARLARSPSYVPYPTGAALLSAEVIPRAGALLARNRTAATAIAVERYRLDHGGALPPSLSTLAPTYIAAVPQDPFVRDPVRMARAPDSYAVYSVGADAHDDGGDVAPYHPDADWSYRPKARDIGIRVPLIPKTLTIRRTP